MTASPLPPRFEAPESKERAGQGGRALIQSTRHNEILALLQERRAVSVAELSELLGVSEVTIRSDLAALQPTGLIRRVRGGVQLPLPLGPEAPLETAQFQHQAAKARIGQAAAALIQEGETIFLDVGSTTTAVARAISPALRHLTVVTNGLNIALELEKHPHVKVIVSGGTLRRLQHSLVSPYGAELLGQVYADRLFLGCNGVHAGYGVTNANHEEAEIKRLMVERAGAVVVVADHSKIGRVAQARVAPLSRVQTLITDREAEVPEDIREQLPDLRRV